MQQKKSGITPHDYFYILNVNVTLHIYLFVLFCKIELTLWWQI